MTKIFCFIPARLKSSRFPNKMLKNIKTKPLIRYVYDKCLKSKYFKKTYVATCDRKIFNEIDTNGGYVVMTNIFHKGCVSRIAEAVKKKDSIKKNDFICIVQGDEVQVDYKILNKFCSFILKYKKKYSIFNVLSKIKSDDEYKSKSVIKVLLDNNKNIINFSRTNITHGIKNFNKNLSKKVFRQTGIIAIRKDLLIKYSKMNRSFFEKKESVDMLRYIENEFRIHSFIINKTMIGIDTPKDYYKFINSLI